MDFLVEAASCEGLLRVLVPRIAPGLRFEVHPFNGKHDLMSKLPQRLRGYSAWGRQAGVRLVVLVDRDSDDCLDLKRRLDEVARCEGLVVASDVAPGEDFDVLTRIAVEELEAWLLGDVPALCAAYPRLPASLGEKDRYRDPDGVAGGTAEALERELQNHGYHAAGLSKIDNPTRMAQHMTVDRNRSASFRCFRDGVRRIANVEETL